LFFDPFELAGTTSRFRALLEGACAGGNPGNPGNPGNNVAFKALGAEIRANLG
jgi:hypothetical protein